MNRLYFAFGGSLLVACTWPHGQRHLTGKMIIRKMQDTVRREVPLSGTLQCISVPGGARIKFKTMGPRTLEIVSNPNRSIHEFTVETHWSGNTFYLYYPQLKAYTMTAEKPNPFATPYLVLIGFERAFCDEDLYSDVEPGRLSRFRGSEVYAVRTTTPEEAGGIKTTLYVDRRTFLPVGFRQQVPGERYASVWAYSGIRTKTKLTEKDFDWRPPHGSRRISYQVYAGASAMTRNAQKGQKISKM